MVSTTISKGFIEKLPEPGSNIFVVRMPIFEDNTGSKMLFNATACCPPGYYGGYSVGDVVFLTFENEEPEMAIILGKLYTVDKEQTESTNIENFSKKRTSTKTVGDSINDASTLQVHSLNVTENVELPINTSLGDLTVKQLEEALRKIEYLEQRIKELE